MRSVYFLFEKVKLKECERILKIGFQPPKSKLITVTKNPDRLLASPELRKWNLNFFN
jgi:hypothetical protein